MNHQGIVAFGLSMALAASANAFILTGSVSDAKGKAVKGASVSLLNTDYATTTDGVGSFTLRDTPMDGIASVAKIGYVGVTNGVLSFSQSSSGPVQLQIFDALGSRILNKRLYGSGEVDLRSFVKNEGTYFAQVQMGSAVQSVKFTARGTYGASYGNPQVKSLKKEEAGGTLQVVFDGFDTLNVQLANLNTNVELTLQKAAGVEETFDFGWAKGNAPVPTRGCGHDLTIPKTGSFEFQWSGGKRTVRVDIPDNYDNQKPYRLVFGMHCMGGWAGGVQQEGYYGMKPLDTEKTTIFIAPEGNGNQAPWAESDYKLFDELLAKLQSELCIDSSRVFSAGFSYGSMFSNGLSRNHKHVLRGIAAYETAEVNIYVPPVDTKGSIAWMGVLGLQDDLCRPEMGRAARNTALKYNGPGFTDASGEQAEEYSGSGPHLCYDYKTVDERFPVKWCTQNGGHIWDHKDPGQTKSWVPQTTWEFFTQF